MPSVSEHAAGVVAAPLSARDRLTSRRAWADPALWCFGILVVALAFLVANPILRLVWDSVHDGNGSLTFANYVGALGRGRNIQALLNSLYLGLAVTAIALALGIPLALAVSRTDMPGRGFTHASVLAAFVMPNFLGAIAWILLAGPNAGWLNKIYVVADFGVQKRGRSTSTASPAWLTVIALYSFPLHFHLYDQVGARTRVVGDGGRRQRSMGAGNVEARIAPRDACRWRCRRSSAPLII